MITPCIWRMKSCRKNIPLRSPLLRTMHERLNTIALARAAVLLWNIFPASSSLPDQRYRKLPVKDNSEKRLSLYGAERNNPAGETTWRQAVMNAIFSAFPVGVSNTNKVDLYSTSVDSKCEMLDMKIPLRACRYGGCNPNVIPIDDKTIRLQIPSSGQ